MLFRLAFVAVGEALSRPRAVRGRGARLVSMAAETHFDYLVIGGGDDGLRKASCVHFVSNCSKDEICVWVS